MAKSLAMKKVQKVPKAKGKAKAKGKPKVQMLKKVQKVAEEEEAQKVAQMPKKATAAAKIKAAQMPKKATAAAKIKAIAAAKQEAVAKAVKKKPSCAEQQSPMKKPSSWDQWADDGEDEEEKGEDSKDCSVPTKAQAYIFERALKMDPGTRGALPNEIHELWNSMQKGPGAAQERHALRNAIVPRDATYGHICKVDPTGPMMQRIRNVWETKQTKIQPKGMSESEMLWKYFQGNEIAMKCAIDKGHIQVSNDMYISAERNT